MLKCLLTCAIAAALSFLSAGVLSHVSVGLSFLRGGGRYGEERYRFCLGCAAFTLFAISGVLMAVWDYPIPAAMSLAASFVGAGVAASCLSVVYGFISETFRKNVPHGGGEGKEPVGGFVDGESTVAESDGEAGREIATDSCDRTDDSDRSANSDAMTVLESDGRVVAREIATNSYKNKIMSFVMKLITEKTRTKAIIWCAIFAVNLVVFSLFVALIAADYPRSVSERSVVFESVERAGDAVFFTANGGEDTYAAFGYLANPDGLDELAARVDGIASFTVRRSAMDEDEWGGYYLLLDVKDADGKVYLAETEAVACRGRAVGQKVAILGGCVVFCAVICGFYTVAWLRRGRTANRQSR